MDFIERPDEFSIDKLKEDSSPTESNKRQIKINKMYNTNDDKPKLVPKTTPRKSITNKKDTDIKDFDIYSNAQDIYENEVLQTSNTVDDNSNIYENSQFIPSKIKPPTMKPPHTPTIKPPNKPPPKIQPTIICSKSYTEESPLERKLEQNNNGGKLEKEPNNKIASEMSKNSINDIINDQVFPSDIREFIQTEIAYCELLEELDKNYLKPLIGLCINETETENISFAQFKDLFDEILAIIKIHTSNILPSALRQIKDLNPESFIQIYRSVMSALKIYSLYHLKYSNLIKKVEYWSKQSVEFNSIINGLNDTSNENEDSFVDYMIKPFYRIKQYKSLLKAYIKEHLKTENEIETAQEYLSEFSKLTKALKKTTILEDSNMQASSLQKKIGDQFVLITPNRKILKHGPVKRLTAKIGEKIQSYLILTTDYLVHCRKLGTLLKVEHLVDLKTATFYNDCDENCIILIRSREMAEEFAISCQTEKKLWIKALQKAFVGNESDSKTFIVGKMAPIWVKDDTTLVCKICSVAFNALKRRHHCRACGELVCAACSDNRESLEYDNYIKHRVCDLCKTQLKMALLNRK